MSGQGSNVLGEDLQFWLTAITALLAVLAATASAITAVVAARLQRRWSAADAFLRIADRFESAEFRKYRSLIYRLDRFGFTDWSDGELAAVDTWCAHLDLVATLVQADQLDRLSILNMYGDVMFRTIYQVAPYCNGQAETRGRQFLLPLRRLTDDLVVLWRKQAKKKRYPITIGFPAQRQVRVNPDLFDSDDAIVDFRN